MTQPAGTGGLQGGAETEFFSLKKKSGLESRIPVAITRAPGAESAARVSPSRGSLSPEPPKRAPSLEQQGAGSTGSLPRETWKTRRRIPSGDGLPFTADSQVPRRNFALHMRRSWLVQCRGWQRRPPGSARGMAWGCAGKRRPTISPIHTGRGEMPGLHLQPQTRPPLLGPRASRALPPRGSGRVVRARHCNPTLHPAPAPGRWALEPAYSRAPPSSGPGARLLPGLKLQRTCLPES